MLGLAEYRAASAELARLGAQYDKLLVEALEGVTSKQEAMKIARQVVRPYKQDYERILRRSLHQIAYNAADHYIQDLGIPADPSQLAFALVEKQFITPYYGATLEKRLAVTDKVLMRRLTQRGNVGVERLPGLFTDPVGGQFNIDKRLLQGTAVKIERDTAALAAEEGDIPFIRWRLSPRHSRLCECDALAKRIDPEVEQYLIGRDSKQDPRGLYMSNRLPEPPHPNCQCEFGMVSLERESSPSPIKRALRSVQKLLRRLRGK